MIGICPVSCHAFVLGCAEPGHRDGEGEFLCTEKHLNSLQ